MSRIVAILLALTLVFALPVEASSTTYKATAGKTEAKAKSIKKGTTTVTIAKSSNAGYIKFKATTTKSQ